jgi:hypothetical protein
MWIFTTPLIWCHISHFSRVMVFAQYSTLVFPICLTILCMSILTVFFLNMWTWESHSHFIGIRYTTRGPIGRNVICSSSPLHYSPYINNLPYLCFFFDGRWDTYNRFHIKCDYYFFTVRTKVFSIKAFNALTKCVVWSPQGLDHYVSLPLGFFTPTSSFHILGALVGSKSIIELFLLEVPQEG